jgi:uncharacterized protein YhfF/GNAT superfamily N-acetyltransferase
MNRSVTTMWQAFLARAGSQGLPSASWHFCDNQEDANACARLVRAGRKRATAPSLWGLQHRGEPLPQPGELHVVTDWHDVAQCVIRTTRVNVVPFNEVTADHAAAEGEGDCTLDAWRTTHRGYYRRELASFGVEPRDDMPVVCEDFDCVYPAAIRSALLADVPEMHRTRMSVHENRLTDPSKVQSRHYVDLLEGRGRGWVAEADGRIVGFAIADLERLDIWALFVDPQQEGHGIGRQLQDAMLDWMFEQGIDRVTVGTTAGTRAERFYARSGWRSVGRDIAGDVRFDMMRGDWLARQHQENDDE